ncbi:MAG: hypothetical protein PHH44_01810 [bacterium]|nr:hypothetical protein [bacterium]
MKKCLIICFLIVISIKAYGQTKPSESDLHARITVPSPYSLIRGDVPIYGIAGGKDFKEYKLEYGSGENPSVWTTILVSSQEQVKESSVPKIDFSLDKTIPGNLGIWDTGLSEYQYGEHKVDLPIGIYTLKLTVKDKSGNIAEDRVIIEVGRVIINSVAGKVESPDGQAIHEIPEHALYDAAEVISLKPVSIKASYLPEETKLLSQIYELNPPEERFTQPASLKIRYNAKSAINQSNIGIFVFNPKTREWEYLETYLNSKESLLETKIISTPADFAIYGVFEDKNIINIPEVETSENREEAIVQVLCHDDFEQGFNQWQSKYGEIGAKLELAQEGVFGKCLKLTQQNETGNFGCTIRNQPFDARQYPLMSFDYKISPEVKINFLVKINNKWYDIVFTDDRKVYWDINMEEIGSIPGVKADNHWQHIEFNLYDMLKEHTRDFIIQEMEIADWDSTGFMKLEFGKTPKGASFYIDNFDIRSDKYFWQIGYKDNSDKEFSDLDKKEVSFSIGSSPNNFPREFKDKINIGFNIPEAYSHVSYQLQIKCVDNNLIDKEAIDVYLNGNLVKKEDYVMSKEDITVFLEEIKQGHNSLTLANNCQNHLRFDFIKINPLMNAPFEIESDSLADVNKELSPEEPTINLAFSVKERNTYNLLINLEKQIQKESWVNFKTFEVMVNGKSIKKIVYGGEKAEYNIPLNKELVIGINRISLNWLEGKGKISLKKIALK